MIEDEAILALFFSRSEQAIEALDLKYGRLCHRISYGILGNRQDAEECVNDAYLGVWNAIPPAAPDPLPPYVCKIVRNLSLKRYSRKAAAKRGSVYEVTLQELEGVLSAPDTVEHTLEARALAQTIAAFLDTLTLDNRIIFMRRYWFFDSYAQIAQQVGLREKTVSVRLVRIRKQLRQYLLEKEVSL